MKDPKTEQFLTRHKYAHVFAAGFPITDIDMKEAGANPARLGKRVDEDRVIEYAQVMQDKGDFPAIVLLDIGDDVPKQLATGYHRLQAAALADIKVFDAYLVREADTFRREMLTRSLNTIEGRSPDLRERLRHIADMHRQFPEQRLSQLAAAFSVKVDTVNNYIKQIDVEERAEQLNVGEYFRKDLFPQKLKLQLGRISNDNNFMGAVNLMMRYPGLRTNAGDLLDQIRVARTEAQVKTLIEEAAREQDEFEESRKIIRRTSSTKATKFLGLIRSIEKLSGGSVEKLCLEGLDKKLRQELSMLSRHRILINEAIVRLEQLVKDRERSEEWRASKDGVQTSDVT